MYTVAYHLRAPIERVFDCLKRNVTRTSKVLVKQSHIRLVVFDRYMIVFHVATCVRFRQ